MSCDFSEAVLQARRPVWAALAELFLDTDTRLFETGIVETLASSPYSSAEIEEILVQEVTPVCMWNVFWWEWAGFDPGWLETEILQKQRSPSRLFYWLLLPYLRFKLRHSRQWARIIQAVKRERKGAAPDSV